MLGKTACTWKPPTKAKKADQKHKSTGRLTISCDLGVAVPVLFLLRFAICKGTFAGNAGQHARPLAQVTHVDRRSKANPRWVFATPRGHASTDTFKKGFTLWKISNSFRELRQLHRACQKELPLLRCHTAAPQNENELNLFFFAEFQVTAEAAAPNSSLHLQVGNCQKRDWLFQPRKI